MKIKKIFDDDGKATMVEVKVRNNNRWNLSDTTFAEAVAEGWISTAKGQVVLHTTEGDVAYNILTAPNRRVGRNHFELEVA